MTLKNFDTHKHIKSLQETGFNEDQAEVIVRSLLEARDSDLSNLSTREQVTKVEAKLSKEIVTTREQVTKVEAKLSKEIATTREQVTKVENKLDIKINKVETKLTKMIIALDLKFTKEFCLVREEMAQLESRLNAKITALDLKFTKEIANVKHDILKWIMPLIITMLGMMLAIMFKLFL